MKSLIYGLIVINALLAVPVSASDCGGNGYGPFIAAMEERAVSEQNKTEYVFSD